MPAKIKSTDSLCNRQTGQVILTLLVLVAFGVTVGLLAVSRSTPEIELSSKIDREARVYSANEAFVEDVLVNPLNPGERKESTINNINVKAQAAPELKAGNPFVFYGETPIGSTQTIWLVPHGPAPDYIIDESNSYGGSTIDICWSKKNATVPGVVVSLLYKDVSGNYKIARGAYSYGGTSSHCGRGGQMGDCFSNQNVFYSTGGGQCDPNEPNLKYRKILNFQNDLGVSPLPSNNTLIAIRIRPMYSGVQIGVKPVNTVALPRQAITDAEVSAQYPDTGESTRIHVSSSYPFAPPIFDYVLFSGQDLSHQQ